MGFEQVALDTIRHRVQEVVVDLPNVAAAYLLGSALAGGF